MSNDILLEDALLLIEQNFYFLHVGEFFTKLSKETDLSKDNDLNIKKTFDKNEEYNFNPHIIKNMLLDAKNSKINQEILFEFFIEMNAIRGICMAMVEAIRLEGEFKIFMQKKLSSQFEGFYDITSFIRNVLSHNIHANMHLNAKDYEGTLQRIIRQKRDPKINLNINYSLNISEIKSPNDEYAFTCDIDFGVLNTSMSLFDVVSPWKLIMLSELCYNFVASYNVHTLKP